MFTDSFHRLPAHDRRRFLRASLALASWSVWGARPLGVVAKEPKLSDDPFSLGVASGDPTPDGVVLWTRLAPQPLAGGGMPNTAVEVSWQVAHDEQMTKIVRQGTTTAVPEWAHSVHVEVAGLEPDRWYFYQFKVGKNTSPIGRTRTMPAVDALPEKLRFAFVSCQHYEQGLYTGYDYLAKEGHDLVLHLGDYIYEGPTNPKGVRQHLGKELLTLDDYRTRHAQYKTDPLLQAAHAACPWGVTWDDHEFDNNCAGAISEELKVTEAEFLKRRAAAYKAYYEHMPLRRSSLPKGPDMLLYRRLNFGRLAEFAILDTRQYRTDQPCGDGNKAPCPQVYDPQGTALGDKQEQWLTDGLVKSPATWNVLAQQIMMARVDRIAGAEIGYSMDQWPGYEVNRRRILKFLHERKIANPIVLAGDIHSNWANHLIADFDHLDSQVVATEFVGTSISSGGDGFAKPKNQEAIYSENPFVKFHDALRGYVRCDLTPKSWETRYQALEYVTKPGSKLTTTKTFVVEAGRPGLAGS